jgi:pimeloyl-ACP methyl ester carboxylesterase
MFFAVFCVIVAGTSAQATEEGFMSNQRTHYVTTTDGVTIGATVHGQGPPLVFVQGTAGDGDLDWSRTVEHLTDRFTCHLPSMRGRGLSGDHPDVSPNRLVDDILAYVDSIGEPIGLVAWSGSSDRALAAAAQSNAVGAVAPFEPVMPQLMDEQLQAGVGDAMTHAGELAAEGKLAAAVRSFLGGFFGEEGTAAAEKIGYFEATGRYLTHMLKVIEQELELGPPAADPTVLGAIIAPVMVLVGSTTMPFFAAAARHVADHVPDGRIREIPGAGHAGPLTHPEGLAEALTDFFSSVQQKA